MQKIVPISQPVPGALFLRGGQAIVLLDDASSGSVWLRYALVTLGVEEHIFPAFLLDDWGNERRGLGLFDWIRENGMLFPRAEVFGVSTRDVAEQLFLRELELYVKLPAYAVLNPEAPASAGIRVKALCLPGGGQPVGIPQPEGLASPLCHIRAEWWRGDPESFAGLGYTRFAG